jgi:hypothetical protein
MNAISGIANMFASELHGVDAVPSDVAVGLILLQQQQEEEDRLRIQDGKVPYLFIRKGPILYCFYEIMWSL